jgi:hypothetical protein
MVKAQRFAHARSLKAIARILGARSFAPTFWQRASAVKMMTFIILARRLVDAVDRASSVYARSSKKKIDQLAWWEEFRTCRKWLPYVQA